MALSNKTRKEPTVTVTTHTDLSFNDIGHNIIDLPPDNTPIDLHICEGTAAPLILASGGLRLMPRDTFGLAQFTSKGEAVTKSVFKIGSIRDDCSSVDQHPNGGYVLFGTGTERLPANNRNYFVAFQILRDGKTPNDAFNKNARKVLKPHDGAARAGAVDSKLGRIVIAGYGVNNKGKYFTRACCLKLSGELETGFGKAGWFLFDQVDNACTDFALADAGHLLLTGQSGDGGFVMRLTADGRLDTSFAKPHGYLTTPSLLTRIASIKDSIYAIGYSTDGRKVKVSKFHANGEVDKAFQGGEVLLNLGKGVSSPNAILMQGDQKVLVSGSHEEDSISGHWAFVARLNSNGKMDRTFGKDGILRIELPREPGYAFFPKAMALQKPRKLVISGRTLQDFQGSYLTFLVRFWEEKTSQVTVPWRIKYCKYNYDAKRKVVRVVVLFQPIVTCQVDIEVKLSKLKSVKWSTVVDPSLKDELYEKIFDDVQERPIVKITFEASPLKVEVSPSRAGKAVIDRKIGAMDKSPKGKPVT